MLSYVSDFYPPYIISNFPYSCHKVSLSDSLFPTLKKYKIEALKLRIKDLFNEKILLFAKLNVAYLYISSYISYYYIITMEKYTITQKHFGRENL